VPNETRLGKSQGKPQGRGVSGKQQLDLYEALADSEAAKTGILSEIAECDLFIEGIGPDKISDITTNIIRSPLIEYRRSDKIEVVIIESTSLMRARVKAAVGGLGVGAAFTEVTGSTVRSRH
jgi:hypothetical protein